VEMARPPPTTVRGIIGASIRQSKISRYRRIITASVQSRTSSFGKMSCVLTRLRGDDFVRLPRGNPAQYFHLALGYKSRPLTPRYRPIPSCNRFTVRQML